MYLVWTLCITLFSFSRITSSQGSFLLESANVYCMYSYAAYCPPESLNQWNCFWCSYLDYVPPIDVQYIFQNSTFNTLGYAGVTKDYIIFSFRGTEIESLKNWIADLASEVLVEYPYIPEAKV